MSHDRDWTQAINKLSDEDNRCRVCPSRAGVQCAHIIRRIADRRPPIGWAVLGNGDWSKPWRVVPDRIVPLCKKHHDEYDAGRLDLLPYLKTTEVLQAVADCAGNGSNGFETARMRITGSREVAPAPTS